MCLLTSVYISLSQIRSKVWWRKWKVQSVYIHKLPGYKQVPVSRWTHVSTITDEPDIEIVLPQILSIYKSRGLVSRFTTKCSMIIIGSS